MKTSFGRACDKKFKTEASRIPEVNQKIQDVVNKERRFPDYHDVMKIYKSVCEERSLDYSKQELSHKGNNEFLKVVLKTIYGLQRYPIFVVYICNLEVLKGQPTKFIQVVSTS